MIVPSTMANQDTLVFDSQWEFDVWYCLSHRDRLSIKIHQYISHLNWYIDYLVDVPKSKNIQPWLIKLNISPHKGRHIYIDAKGTLDNRTVQRILAYPDRTQKRIVLITPKKIIHSRFNAHIVSGDEVGIYQWVKEHPCKVQLYDGRVLN